MKYKYLILGLGKSGLSVQKFFERKNIKFLVFDDNKKEKEESFDDIDVLIKSPGIRNDQKIVRDFLEKKKRIVTDLELLNDYMENKKTICVTGTNGKSTTVTLLKMLFSDYELVGNIGVPIFDKVDTNSNLIIECSSYMCEYVKDFKPNYSILLNIHPNHLDHHLTLDNYISSKGKLIKNTKDCVCYNYDDFYTRQLISKIKEGSTCTYLSFSTKNPQANMYILNSNIYFEEKYICSINDFIPYLRVYPENILATLLLYIWINKSYDGLVSKLNKFKGLEHRLECFYETSNYVFYNDSKSTNLYALNRAINVFRNDNLILICGGLLPKDSFEDILCTYNDNLKQIYIVGENEIYLKKIFIKSGYSENIIKIYNSLEDVIINIKKYHEKLVVLFSPGSQSFDKYKNFEERGRAFKELVFKYY